MSWDRDEAANLQEAINDLVQAQREFVESFTQFRQQNDSPPRGGDSGPSATLDIDTKPILEFTTALQGTLSPLRVFSRSLEMLSEKIDEAFIQKPLPGPGGAGPGGRGPGGGGAGPGGAGGGAGANQQPLQFPTSSILRPSQYMIPNQYGGFTVYNMGGAGPAQQPVAVPSQTLNPGQVRRRQALRRRRMRQFYRKRQMATMTARAMRGAYYGGMFGGVRGAIRGGIMSAGIRAISSPYTLAAGLTVAAPFMMRSSADAADAQLDQNRRFSMATPALVQSLIQYDINTFTRNMELARATEGTALNLAGAMDRERQAQQPFDIMTRNVGNAAGTFFSNMSAKFFESTAGIWEGINSFVASEDTQRGLGAAGRVSGEAGKGAMIGSLIGMFTIPVLGAFGPALGAAVGSLFGAASGLGQEFNKPGDMAVRPKGVGMNGVDGGFLDVRFAPKPRKI